MCKLTTAGARLADFVDDNPQIVFTKIKKGANIGGYVREGGACRWIRTIKQTTHEDRGPTAITLGYWSGKGWIVGVCRADSAGDYSNSNHIHDKAYDSFYRAAVAFLEEVDHLI